MAAGRLPCFLEGKGGVESSDQGLRELPGGLGQEGEEATLQSCSYLQVKSGYTKPQA